jgi:hypothetical protein
MSGHKSDDPLNLRGLKAHFRIDPPFPENIEPQRAIGIDHDLDHVWVAERRGDRWAHGRAQHGAAAAFG